MTAAFEAFRTRLLAPFLARLPDTDGFFENYLGTRPRQYLVCLLAAMLLRVGTFGDPNLHVDEAFYFLVGQRMHDGVLPYVDVWDRKPFGLFLLYYLIAFVSTSVIAYQAVALIFAASTAMVINLICRRWSGAQGGLLAGLAYLIMLGPLLGFGGQAPVFYNLFIATAAYFLIEDFPRLTRGRPGWKTYGAMALCGFALTIKQTTLFESVFFGLFAVYLVFRAGVAWPRLTSVVLRCALLGAAPTLAIAACYTYIGHWPEFWQAMVMSNLTKSPSPLYKFGLRILLLFLRAYPILCLALFGAILFKSRNFRRVEKNFLVIWTVSAFAGFLVIPNAYMHYALPLLVPISVYGSFMLGDSKVGVLLFIFVIFYSFAWFKPWNFDQTSASRVSMEKLSRGIQRHDSGGGLLVFDGPPYLYAMTDEPFLTPLSFPHHLNHLIEKNVSHINTRDEIRRILGNRPGVVAMSVFPRNYPVNRDSRDAVMAYVQNNCRVSDAAVAYEINREDLVAIYGDCRAGAPDMEL